MKIMVEALYIKVKFYKSNQNNFAKLRYLNSSKNLAVFYQI
ncbi:hypothetical protein JCM19274_1124 [Algibacter lectus]|uniref:Uncharacterized protein n=1 Tax=Algibacter lectus TaxID=221126 RepID=A0A090WNH3_9FLAO|nr:hypothetical protein JCM19274_1124 [Algibacter lectus]